MKYLPIAPAPSPDSSRIRGRLRLNATGKIGLLLAATVALCLTPVQAGVRTITNPSTPNSTATNDRTTSTVPSETLVPSSQPIPYQNGPIFADNRVGGDDVKLPPLPTSLYPVPPPERKPLPVVLPRPGLIDIPTHRDRPVAKSATTSTPTAHAANPSPSGPNVILGTSDTPEQNVAVSPFINWITQNPNAVDIARQSQDGYSVSGVAENAIGSNDLFYNIRFPYTGGAQTPPGNSAVIYTTPKR